MKGGICRVVCFSFNRSGIFVVWFSLDVFEVCVFRGKDGFLDLE